MVLKLSSVSWLVVQHLLTEADEKLGADWYECKNGGARLVLVSFDSVRLSREARRSAPLWRRGRLMSLSSLCMFGAMASMEPVWLEKNGISMSSCWPNPQAPSHRPVNAVRVLKGGPARGALIGCW